ncbi:MAG: hypothetical protein HXX18_04925 [Bacteroidetes bacterium]|nr:hypothetical protein [Bacteroidota bacterium]
MKLKNILISVIFIFSFGQIYAQNLEFYREDITFGIKDKYFYVKGDYYFYNVGNDSVNSLLFYPFPIDSNYGNVDSINIIMISDSSNAIQNISESGALFALKIKPYGSKKNQYFLSIKIIREKAEYILLTTKE